MNERLVELPSGGRAWVRLLLNHDQATELRRHSLRLSRFIGPRRNEDGTMGEGWRTDLTPDEQDAKDELRLAIPAVNVRTLTTRWEGVKDGAGDELAFPTDVGRMQERDFQALFLAVTEPQKEAEGNAPPPSQSSSEPASGPTELTPI